MHRPLCCVSAAILLVVAGLTEASAGTPRWKFKPEEVARYRVESDAKPQAGKQLVRLPAGLRLDHSSFQQGIRWNGKVTQMADLIHRYVLSLPVGRKKGSYIVWDEVIKQIPPYRVDASSLGRAKVKGSSKLKIEGEVLFAKSPRANPNYEIKAGKMTWRAVFDGREGVLLTANYEFEMELVMKTMKPPRSYTYVSSGRYILIDKGKRDPKDIRKGIEKAIAKGVEALKKGSGAGMTSRMGYLAINLFALLRAGVSPDDPVVAGGFKKLLAMPLDSTYDVSLLIMALEARSIRREPPRGTSSVPRFVRGKVAGADLQLIQKAANWLIEARNKGKGTWHYKSAGGPGEGGQKMPAGSFDNSNTQFAVLALHAAHRAGAKVPVEVWWEIFQHFKGCQCQSTGTGNPIIKRVGDSGKGKRVGSTVTRGGSSRGGVAFRGWAYGQAGSSYGSMTNAGLSSLAIAADMLKGARRLTPQLNAEFERMAAEGLGWQAKNYSITENPGQGGDSWYYYYMYSLEKACELLGVEEFEGHDWFLEGADYLCTLQKPDGNWGSMSSDTALALLFLNRATLRTTVNILPKRSATGLGRGTPGDRATVLVEDAKGLISLKELLASLKDAGSRERRERTDWFEEGIEKLAEIDRPIVMPELIDLLENRRVRSWAKKRLREITGDSRLRKPEDFKAWSDTWSLLDRSGPEHNYEAIPELRKVLREEKNRLLRKLAMLSAVRLRAVEAAEDIAPLLDGRGDEPKVAADCLSVLIGKRPKDEKEVKAWVDASLEKALADQQSRRDIARAAKGDEALTKTIVSAGKTWLSELVRWSRDPHIGEGVRGLLVKITGETKIGPDDWQSWWAKNKDKVGKDGKLPKPKKAKGGGAKAGGAATPAPPPGQFPPKTP